MFQSNRFVNSTSLMLDDYLVNLSSLASVAAKVVKIAATTITTETTTTTTTLSSATISPISPTTATNSSQLFNNLVTFFNESHFSILPTYSTQSTFSPFLLPLTSSSALPLSSITDDIGFPPTTELNHKLEHAPQLSKSAIIRCVVLSAMAIISLLGNTATMWNIYKTRMTRRTTRHSWSAIYSLIFHLSIADLLVTGFCIIGEAAWSYTVQWLAGDITCKSVKLFQMFSLYLSTYVLVLIGVDRWIAVKYPMKSLNMAKRCYRLLGGAYVLSFVLSLPQFFIFRVARGPFIEDFYQCVTHGFYTAVWQEQLYTTFTLFFTFIIPLCILIVTYLSTFRTISGSEKMFQGSKLAVYTSKPPPTNRQRLIHKAKMKSLRISVVIIVAFLICWTPYNVMMIIFTFLNPNKRLGEDLQSGIFFFGMSNSLVNPLIYGAFHLCPLKRNNSQYTHYSLTRDNSHSYQRSPSLMTGTTQIDSNGRHTFKRASYYQRGTSIRKDHHHLNQQQQQQFNLIDSPSNKLNNTMAQREYLRQNAVNNDILKNGNKLLTNNHNKIDLGFNQNGIQMKKVAKVNISSV